MHDKIRKMMALANDPGATPEEAANAAAMAAELALKYNIDMASIQIDEAPKPKEFVVGGYSIKVTPRDRKAGLHLAGGVSKLYAVKLVLTRIKEYWFFTFIGQPHNVELANHWLNYLWASMKRANSEYHKTLTHRATYAQDGSFRLMFAYTVQARLYEKFEAMQRHGISGSTALVVYNFYEKERAEIDAWVKQSMALGKPLKSRAAQLESAAASAGAAAGKRIGLDEQVRGPQQQHAALR